MNKKAESDEILIQQIIFVVLNVFFFTALLIFVVTAGSEEAVIEEQYAKEIALAFDSMLPDMEVNFSAAKFYELVKKNEVKNPITISGHMINIKLKNNNQGYSFNFFSSLEHAQVLINSDNKIITLRT